MGRTPVNKLRSSNIAKQKSIINALQPHYLKLGIKAISAEEMCRITGKSKATLYKYFESRKEMIQQILISKLEILSSFHEILKDESTSYKSRYQSAVTIATHSISDISSIFLEDLAELFPDLYEQILNVKKMSLDLLKDFYANGIREQAFIDVNPEILALNDELFFDAISNPNFLKNRNLTLLSAFEGYFKTRFDGIIKK